MVEIALELVYSVSATVKTVPPSEVPVTAGEYSNGSDGELINSMRVLWSARL